MTLDHDRDGARQSQRRLRRTARRRSRCRRHSRRWRTLMPQGNPRGKLSPTSGSFAAGRMTVAIPARQAASTFSRMPATGSTCLPSVSSPVIAMSPRADRPVNVETMATARVTPAEAPSFDQPASGRCACRRSIASSKPASKAANRPAFARTHVSATCADSVSFGPTVPVTRNAPPPGRRAASTTSTSPPLAVTPRPRATPGRRVRPASSSSRNRGAPSHRATGPPSPASSPRAVKNRRPTTRSCTRCDGGGGAPRPPPKVYIPAAIELFPLMESGGVLMDQNRRVLVSEGVLPEGQGEAFTL